MLDDRSVLPGGHLAALMIQEALQEVRIAETRGSSSSLNVKLSISKSASYLNFDDCESKYKYSTCAVVKPLSSHAICIIKKVKKLPSTTIYFHPGAPCSIASNPSEIGFVSANEDLSASVP
jgi:hypothetical protein